MSAPINPTLGGHEGFPDEIYRGPESHNFVSSSGLRALISKSPAHYRAKLLEHPEETQVLSLGKVLHCCVLETECYARSIAVAPNVDKRTSEDIRQDQKYIESPPGTTLISTDDAARTEGVAAAIEAHPLGSKQFRGGIAEVTGLYTDPKTDIAVKIRPDYYRGNDSVIVDLKTNVNASSESFSRCIFRFGYHFQAAKHLVVAAQILDRDIESFVFVAVEKLPPYAVGVYELDKATIWAGIAQYVKASNKYAVCLANGKWPAYSDQIERISLTKWPFTN